MTPASPAPAEMAATHTPMMAEHIEWAAEHGALESVATFLRGLREDEWFHSGD